MKTRTLSLIGALTLALGVSLATPSQAQKPGGRRADPAQLFAKMDKNNDGKLTKDEVPERLWERIVRLDENKDGAVTKEELAKMREKQGKAFEKIDKNNDGKLTKDEVPEKLWARISRLDANKDGAISKEEFEKGARQVKRASGKRKGGDA